MQQNFELFNTLNQSTQQLSSQAELKCIRLSACSWPGYEFLFGFCLVLVYKDAKKLDSSVQMGPEEEEEEEEEEENEKEVELVLSTAEDLKDLNVNQLLGHLYSTKNKEASNGIQQCILEGMHMSSICDLVKPDKRLQKILRKNKTTYARTQRSQLIRLY